MGWGQTAPNPVLTTMRYFKDEYLAHIVDQRCPAGVCLMEVAAPGNGSCPAAAQRQCRREAGMITLTIDGTDDGGRAWDHHPRSVPGARHRYPTPVLPPRAGPVGGCRLCLVEIEGQPTRSPVVACGVPTTWSSTRRATCSPGCAVTPLTSSSLTTLRCVVCDKNGACDLQRYAYQYGVAETSYEFELSRSLFQQDNPFFVRDHQYCILCAKCVRVCDEVVGANAIDLVGRGFTSHVATPFDGPMVNSSCVFCGNCVQVCPTAALLPVSRLGKGREWELERTRTICGYCGVGCGIEYARKDGAILYAQGYARRPSTASSCASKAALVGTSPPTPTGSRSPWCGAPL